MTTRTFVSKPHQWRRNVDDSHATAARPAVLVDFRHAQHPGVIISQGAARFMLLTNEDAMRLAHEIADILTTNNERTTA